MDKDNFDYKEAYLLLGGRIVEAKYQLKRQLLSRQLNRFEREDIEDQIKLLESLTRNENNNG